MEYNLLNSMELNRIFVLMGLSGSHGGSQFEFETDWSIICCSWPVAIRENACNIGFWDLTNGIRRLEYTAEYLC